MSATKSAATNDKTASDSQQWGRLLICGGTDWPRLGRKDRTGSTNPETGEPLNPDLLEPHILRSLVNVRITSVHTSCASCHFVAIDVDGNAWLFGRNGFSCLGVSGEEYISENAPRMVKASELGAAKGTKFVHAACGRNHTLLVGSDGSVWSAGVNNLGQCGHSTCPEVPQFKAVNVTHGGNKERVVQASAGISFSLVLTDAGKVFSFGSAEKGQLGNGTTGERITTGNKTAFDIEDRPIYVKELDGKKIVQIASGQQHSLALDDTGVVYVWGYNGYCRLGLGNQVDILKPKPVPQFSGSNDASLASAISAGPTSSVSTLYLLNVLTAISGKTVERASKNIQPEFLIINVIHTGSSGSPYSTFRFIQDIMGCKISLARSGGVTHWLITPDDDGTPMTVCYGQNAANGELGLGVDEPKSSTKPTKNIPLQEIEIIEWVFNYALGGEWRPNRLYSIAPGQNTTVLLAKPNDDKFSDLPRHPIDVQPPQECVGCKRDDGDPLECDKCDAPWHLECLNPPLSAVPDGEWFCPQCLDDPGAPVGLWRDTKTNRKRQRPESPMNDARAEVSKGGSKKKKQ
ncbi:hypothetical protein D9756_002116 [Leucocoprinus leucothites]|uniref:PHD-type domain-containing protein n=1 Tax=Leucocoprinus leucothites TaxID=201217 RepID=A0A8H5LM11_9AGAR|nr:hypothetical protein D9756_002116 [Leucoagaricus leucothites]